MEEKNIKETIISLLRGTRREGIDSLINYLINSDFFISPASTRNHGCYIGGLANHSLVVCEKLMQFNEQLKLGIDENSIIIAALLHDVCKIDAYVRTKTDDGWTNNRNKDKGHALLSIARIKKFIKLTELEEMIIKYHMGIYGLVEFDEKSGEYTLRNESMANAWYHYPIVKVMYFCDELVTLEEKNGF